MAPRWPFEHNGYLYTLYECRLAISLYLHIRILQGALSESEAHDTIGEIIRYRRSRPTPIGCGTYGPTLNCDGLLKRLIKERMADMHEVAITGANYKWVTEARNWYSMWMDFMGAAVKTSVSMSSLIILKIDKGFLT